MVGFWQIALILYILLLAIGPRRVVRWVRITNRTMDAVLGRPRSRAQPRTPGWLRAIELFEHSTAAGWACVALGIGLLVLDGVCRQSGCAFTGPPVLVLAMLFLFLAPWLI